MFVADRLQAIKARGKQNKQYLHSPAHLLADELSKALNDPKHFGLYLKLATTHDHALLRKVLGDVQESKNVKNAGKLFVFLVKKAQTASEQKST